MELVQYVLRRRESFCKSYVLLTYLGPIIEVFYFRTHADKNKIKDIKRKNARTRRTLFHGPFIWLRQVEKNV
jgi:hypothetical protein